MNDTFLPWRGAERWKLGGYGQWWEMDEGVKGRGIKLHTLLFRYKISHATNTLLNEENVLDDMIYKAFEGREITTKWFAKVLKTPSITISWHIYKSSQLSHWTTKARQGKASFIQI